MNGVDFDSLLKRNQNVHDRNTDRKTSTSSRFTAVSEPDFSEEPTTFKEEITFVKELEESSKGKVKGSLLLNYIKSSKIPCALALLSALFVITQTIASTADIWVSYWIRIEENRVYLMQLNAFNQSSLLDQFNSTSSTIYPNLWSTDVYIYIYCGIIISFLILAILRSVFFSLVCTRASQKLHDTMFKALISTEMKFFNENPAGRIMNRFTKDMGSADEILPITLLEATQIILLSLGSVAVTIFTDVKLSVIIFILIVLFFWLRKLYLKCSTNIKRLEGISE